MPSVDATTLGRNSTSEGKPCDTRVVRTHQEGVGPNKNTVLEKVFPYLSTQLELEEKVWHVFI